eukprot:GABV01011441.1.p2 GENE.GABV01011441.1~~GABV01011441.1.p2  ORF type:complete len:102 (-),score=4.53 GABV01011441.1:14-319(-)
MRYRGETKRRCSVSPIFHRGRFEQGAEADMDERRERLRGGAPAAVGDDERRRLRPREKTRESSLERSRKVEEAWSESEGLACSCSSNNSRFHSSDLASPTI